MSVDIAEDILVWMSLGKRARKAPLSLRHFDGAFPFNDSPGDVFAGEAPKARTFAETRVPESGDVRLAVNTHYHRKDRDGVTLWRMNWPTVRRARGTDALRYGSCIATLAECSFDSDGHYDTAEIVVQKRRGVWVPVRATKPLPPNGLNEIATLCYEGGSDLVAEARRWWSVFLSFDESPSLRFLTDPTGVREVFRLRDLPPGAKRRAALLHWVRGHWRTTKSDDDLAWVRRHLRGARRFAWNGLFCDIAAPSDIELTESDESPPAEL